MIFKSTRPDIPPVPSNLTIPQFFFDYKQEGRPVRPDESPFFIEDGGSELKYDEAIVRERADRLAYAMHKFYGVKEGDVVATFSPNHIDYPIAMFATHRAYAVITPANPYYKVPELTYQLSHSNASLIFAHPPSLETVLQAAAEAGIPDPASRVILFPLAADASAVPRPNGMKDINELVDAVDSIEAREWVKSGRVLAEDEAKTKLAFLCFSSGTTGRSKGVCISHHSLISCCVQLTEHVRDDPGRPFEKRRYREGDVFSLVLPIFHIFGLGASMYFPVYAGMPVLVTARFNVEDYLKSMEKYKIAVIYATPPHLSVICNHPDSLKYDLSSLRHFITGGAPLGVDGETILSAFHRICPNASFGQGYGLTETLAILLPSQDIELDPETAGFLIPGTLGKIVRDDGDLAEYDEPGELLLAGPQIAIGYLNNPEATAESWEEGWLRTGDLALIRPNGGIVILDRMKEVFKVRGFQVAPAELESHLMGHPDVADCCVFGVPDTFSGALPFAYVRLREKAKAKVAASEEGAIEVKESIKQFVADSKVDYKWLDDVEFIEAIPRNPTGKILRRVIMAQHMEALRAAKTTTSPFTNGAATTNGNGVPVVNGNGTTNGATNGTASSSTSTTASSKPKKVKKPFTDAEETKLRIKTIAILELEDGDSETAATAAFDSGASLLSLGMDSLKATKLVHAARPYVVIGQGDVYGGMSYDDVVAFIRNAQAQNRT